MGKRINNILFPKREGLTGDSKPRVLVVHSPHDASEAAVSYPAAIELARGVGYGLVNKGRLTFDATESSDLLKAIKAVKLDDKPMTLWLESHGAPGWLFGGTRDHKDELRWTRRFAAFVKDVEAHTGTTIDNIILNGCFTANEFVSPDSGSFMNSPARILSLFLPGKNIVGFVGQNASAKVTNVFHLTDDGFSEVTVRPEEAAVLFRDGGVVESYHELGKAPLYCTHKYTPMFISRLCGLDLDPETKALVHYRPCLAVETMERDKSVYIDPACYGAQQLAAAKKQAEKFLEREEVSSTHTDTVSEDGASAASSESASLGRR